MLAHHAIPHVAIIVVLFAASLTIWVYGNGDKPLTVDETQTVRWASYPLSDVAEMTREAAWRDHAPMYYIFMNLWQTLGSHSEEWLRTSSALFATLTVVLVYLASWTITRGWTGGIIAAVLFVLSPHVYWYAQDFRLYMFVGFFTMLGIYTMILGAVYYRTHIPTWLGHGLWQLARGRIDRPSLLSDLCWLILGISIFIIVTSHHAVATYSVALGLTFLCMLVFVPNRGRIRLTINFSVMTLVIVALYALWILPELLLSLDTYGSYRGRSLGRVLSWVYSGGAAQYVLAITVPAAIAGLYLQYRRRSLNVCLPLVLPGLIAVFGLFLIGNIIFTGLTIHHPKVVLWAFAPFCVLVGIGLSALYPSLLGKAVLVVALSALIYSGVNGVMEQHQRYKGVSAGHAINIIKRKAVPGDVIVVNPTWYHKAFHYYWRDAEAAFPVPVYLGTCRDEYQRVERVPGGHDLHDWYRWTKRNMREDEGEDFSVLYERYERIWLVSGWSIDCYAEHIPNWDESPKPLDVKRALTLIEIDGARK